MASDPRFERTLDGKITRYRFHKNPLIWVEGVTDCTAYQPLARSLGFDLEASGGGKLECHKLAAAMIAEDRPFVVIMDGDYDILERRRSWHRRVVLLARHSIENYFIEERLLESTCDDFLAGKGGSDGVVERFRVELKRFQETLRDLVILDVAMQREECGVEVLPSNIAALLDETKDLSFDHDRLQLIREEAVREAGARLRDDAERRAARLIDEFTDRRRVVDVVKGHLVFSWIRRFIVGEVRRAGGRMSITNDVLRVVLSNKMWREIRGADHRSLRRRVGRAVREVRRMR